MMSSQSTSTPVRIWKPISFASNVVALNENSSPDPKARKTGAATTKCRAMQNMSTREIKTEKKRYKLIPNHADILPRTKDGEDSTQHKRKEGTYYRTEIIRL